jgi:hypothetical protein
VIELVMDCVQCRDLIFAVNFRAFLFIKKSKSPYILIQNNWNRVFYPVLHKS